MFLLIIASIPVSVRTCFGEGGWADELWLRSYSRCKAMTKIPGSEGDSARKRIFFSLCSKGRLDFDTVTSALKKVHNIAGRQWPCMP